MIKRKRHLFTSQHYLVISKAINDAINYAICDHERDIVYYIIGEIMSKFSKDNPNFNPEDFRASCFKKPRCNR